VSALSRLPVSVVIPTFNMAHHLDQLLNSLKAVGLFDHVREVLVVDDGSYDETSVVLQRWSSVKALRLEKNRGRFWARFLGAQKVDAENILFLDTRLVLAENFLLGLENALASGGGAVGWVDIDTTKNIFCLYWQRSHEFIFKNHYSHRDSGAELTLENYDNFLKGTGVFLCKTKDFLEVCQEIQDLDIKSDDTLLMKKLLKKTRMFINPNMRIWWEPRDSLKDFLARIVDRGPGFVEYHILTHRGLFFYISMLMLVILFGWIGLLSVAPAYALIVGFLSLITLALSARLFAQSWLEWRRLAILHTLVTLSFVVGLIYGCFYHLKRYLARGSVG